MGRLFDYLDDPVVQLEPDFDTLKQANLADFVTRLRDGGVDYTVENLESDPAVKAAETASYRDSFYLQALNHTARTANLVRYAFGADLDQLFLAPAGMERLPGESDEAAQDRYILEQRLKSYGTHDDSYRARVRRVDSLIIDVSVSTRVVDYSNREVVLHILTSQEDGRGDQDLIDRATLAMNDQVQHADGVARVVVEYASILDVDISGTIYQYERAILPDDMGAVLMAAHTKERKLKIDLTRSYIYRQLHLSGVHSIVLADWQDVIAGDHQAIRIRSATFTKEVI